MIVTVNFDGRVLDTEVVRDLGQPHAGPARPEHRAQPPGPFGRFSDAMRRKADQIVVVSRFKFTRDETLETKLTEPMTMDHYCVIGNPVEHSKSPCDPRALRRADRPGAGLRQAAGAARTVSPPAVRRLRSPPAARGCNVTVPFKFEAFGAGHARPANAPRWPRPPTPCASTTAGDRRRQHRRRRPGQRHPANAGVPPGRPRPAAARRRRRGGRRAGSAADGAAAPARRGQPHACARRWTWWRAMRRIRRCEQCCKKQSCSPRNSQGLQADFDVIINATASSLSGGERAGGRRACSSPARWPTT